MFEFLQRLRFEPRAAHPTGPGKRDWLLIGALVVSSCVEVALRPEEFRTGASLVISIALVPTLLWRRSRPLSMALLGFGLAAAIASGRLVTGSSLPELHTTAFLLLLPYSIFRWGSGVEMLLGAPFILASSALGLVSHRAEVGDFIGGLAVVVTAMTLGAAVRYRDRLRSHELEQARMLERERLARELHDTVAHHVSAIAIRAQAGIAVSAAQSGPAVDALRVIETEASRTLAEMRAIVRLLRQRESAGLAPAPSIADLKRLADRSAGGPVVAVDIAGAPDDLPPAVAAALYRLAQESITNARRHARRATRIEVGITADEASVRLRVSDDGDPTPTRPAARPGYGLTGMLERAALLGGTCNAGPNPERGWTVTAVLPRKVANP